MTDSRIDRIVAWYQPIVDLNTGRVAGFEALSRLTSPDGTIGSAGRLMDEFERDPEAQYALIRRLLRFIRTDIVHLFEFRPDFYISINVPPSVMGTGRIALILTELSLQKWMPRLVVELTERQALTDLGRASIDTARSLGVTIALDDFGTGHSGLSQFVGLDLDMLKIDRSLLLPILDNPSAARMLRGIVGLAAALRMRTVAEGVESWEQAFFLRAAGVDYGQGFYWSRAVPGEQVAELLQRGFAHTLGPPRNA
ncbi:MAG: EAL domain-containing protein [Gammaproteobacteria bacterium]|jgi:EAL domain-containing protein (putative c-di-GMP-specific phosphodiesterase class I)|nr:EAL domain-containing protein [Gammaproteobacteria bacterium]